MRNIIIFDFDNTVVDQNTDYVILDMYPDTQELLCRKKKYSLGWSTVMSVALEHLHNRGVTKCDIDHAMSKVPFVEGIPKLFEFLVQDWRNNSNEALLFIVSHSNSHFISVILELAGYDNIFENVYTYPAEWCQNGLLKVHPHEASCTDHCAFCPVDSCKGIIINNEIASYRNTDEARVFYIGDGKNDFCAALNLSDKDYILYRQNFALDACIKRYSNGKRTEDGRKLLARPQSWASGFDLIDFFKSMA